MTIRNLAWRRGLARAAVAGLALLLADAGEAAATAQLKPLYDFAGKNDGMGGPAGELILGSSGLYYGVTPLGGVHTEGTVYSTNLQGRTHTLHAFAYKEGDSINGPLVQTSDGSLYGTAFGGGIHGHGSIFRLAGDGTFTVLTDFDGQNGDTPTGGLILGSDGNLYGVTGAGGTAGLGTLYVVTPAGEQTVLHDFSAVGQEGNQPTGMLIETADGALVGITADGGAKNSGTIFKLGSDGAYGTIHSFDPRSGPCGPTGGLVDGHDGWLYGLAQACGAAGAGAVYRVKIDGTFQTVHDFAGGTADGNLPAGRLELASDGLFYGVTTEGGANDEGVVFQLAPSGRYAVLASFGGTSGERPRSGLLQTAPGQFIGAAPQGGPAAHGDTYLVKLR